MKRLLRLKETMRPVFGNLSGTTHQRRTPKIKRQHKRQNSGKIICADLIKLCDRLLLEEIGFLAGQHEMIDTAYGKDAFEEVKMRVREVKKEIDGNKKQFKDMEGQMNKSYQRMEGATNRYRDAHNMMETACDAFDRVSTSMDVTKNDIERAKGQMDVKTQACQNAKSEYASQMQTSNKEQKDHFMVHLPDLISK